MRRACDDPQFIFLGEARSMPGLLFRLVYPDGEMRDYLMDSFLDAAVFAGHFRAELAFDLPEVVSPMRAVCYENLMDLLHASHAALRARGSAEREDL